MAAALAIFPSILTRPACKNTHNARRLSQSVFFCVLPLTLGAIDWFKSLSTIGFQQCMGLVFAACIRCISSIIILTVVLAKGYLKGILKQAHRYDIARMMLAFTAFWAYISFSYFLIYSANIPEDLWKNICERTTVAS